MEVLRKSCPDSAEHPPCLCPEPPDVGIRESRERLPELIALDHIERECRLALPIAEVMLTDLEEHPDEQLEAERPFLFSLEQVIAVEECAPRAMNGGKQLREAARDCIVRAL